MKKGMTLIELVAAFIIAGLLIGMGVPNFIKIQARIQQKQMFYTLREMAKYEIVSKESYGSFFPQKKNNETLEFILYPDGTTSPEGINLKSMLFRFPETRKHIYYVYWFYPIIVQNNGDDNNGGDTGGGGTGDSEGDDNGDDNNGGDNEHDGDNGDDNNGGDNEHDGDNGDDNNGGDNEHDGDNGDDDDDDDDDDKNGKHDKGGGGNNNNQENKINLVIAEPYFCIYAYASKTEKNDLDGDEGQDIWYVDSYTSEPTPVNDDLKD